MIKKILFSQPQPSTVHNPYTRLEEQYGVQCDFYQFIHIEGLTAKEFRQQRIHPLDYSAVILNSKLGIEHYFRLCEEMRITVPDTMHYYCNSEQVGLYLQKYIQYRKRKVFFPETGNRFEDVLPAMHRRPHETYLMVLSDIHTQEQINMFAENNIEVKPAIMYRTVAAEWPAEKAFDYDMIVFFNPADVKSLYENQPEFKQEGIKFVSYGKSIVTAMNEAGLAIEISAPSPEAPSVAKALELYLSKNN